MIFGQTISSIKRDQSILWDRYIGRMHWRNNIKFFNDNIYLSTSGRLWNSSDDLDGVSCISGKTGDTIWFCQTNSDANEISHFGTEIIVGTDKGDIFAIDISSGSIITKISLNCPVYSRAISISISNRLLLVIVSYDGDIVIYDDINSTFEIIGKIPFKVRCNPLTIQHVAGAYDLLIGSDDGSLVALSIKSNEVSHNKIYQIPMHKSYSSDFNLSVIGINSLLISGDNVIVSYCRDTYDEWPPIECFSLATHSYVWRASRQKTVSKKNITFGNARTLPVLWRDQVLTTFAYDNSLHSFSLETGRWLWKLQLDNGFFQNWASAVLEGDMLYVPRVNGIIAKVNLLKREIQKSVSLEVFDYSKNDGYDSDDVDGKSWPPSRGWTSDYTGPYPEQVLKAGISSTPLYKNGLLYCGTISGHLYCLRI